MSILRIESHLLGMRQRRQSGLMVRLPWRILKYRACSSPLAATDCSSI